MQGCRHPLRAPSDRYPSARLPLASTGYSSGYCTNCRSTAARGGDAVPREDEVDRRLVKSTTSMGKGACYDRARIGSSAAAEPAGT